AALDTQPRKKETTKPQKGEAAALAEAENCKSKAAPKIELQRRRVEDQYRRVEDQDRKVKSRNAEAHAMNRHPSQKPDVSDQDSETRTDYKKRNTVNADPVQIVGTQDVSGWKPKPVSRAEIPNPELDSRVAGLDIGAGRNTREPKNLSTTAEARTLRHKSDGSIQTASKGLEALEPEVKRVRASKSRNDAENSETVAKDVSTPGRIQMQFLDRPEETGKMAKNTQRLQDGKVPIRERSFSDSQVESDPTKGLHTASKQREKAYEGAADRDNVEHGTHCAALLLELSPYADIYVARVSEERTNRLSPDTVAKYQTAVAEAIDHAATCGVLVCAAASNGGANDDVAFPARDSPVICVHSTNEHGKPSDFTPNPLPFAPNFAVIGENVEAAWPGRENGHSQSGTSTATPILAAVMALVLEFVDQKPRKTADEKRLRDHRVMTKVLRAMSDKVEGYHFVRPWKVMSSNDDRGRVESRIQDAIASYA
ncbi:MAG: hypothetical protein L6R35_006691, partial [Caloplaca aegaea]